MVLLDTDVLVEYLRGSTAARSWFESIPKETFSIHGVAAMELLLGSSNRENLRQIRKFVESCRIIWPEPSEFARAYEILAAHRLTSGIGIPDCLIAATALSRAARLYTFNLKHFQKISGLDAQAPYPRA